MGTTEQFQRAQTDRKAAAEIVKNAVSAQSGKAPDPAPKPDPEPAKPESQA
jgi:hypothetical protein